MGTPYIPYKCKLSVTDLLITHQSSLVCLLLYFLFSIQNRWSPKFEIVGIYKTYFLYKIKKIHKYKMFLTNRKMYKIYYYLHEYIIIINILYKIRVCDSDSNSDYDSDCDIEKT